MGTARCLGENCQPTLTLCCAHAKLLKSFQIEAECSAQPRCREVPAMMIPRSVTARPIRLLVALLAMLGMTTPVTPASAGPKPAVQVVALETNGLTTPLGVDDAAPQLSWQLAAGGRHAQQSAYQVRAGTSISHVTAGKPELWDSGIVASSRNAWVSYAGPALPSATRVYWQVRSWTTAGASAWSPVSWFETGLLRRSDWSAKWIEFPGWSSLATDAVSNTATSTPFPVFTKRFDLPKRIKSARLYLTGLGMVAATVNGKSIGRAVLEPGQTDLWKEVQYRVYDVGSLLRTGSNVIEIRTGAGQYLTPVLGGDRYACVYCKNLGRTGPPRVIAQLHSTAADGSRQTLGTGPDWQTALGATTFSSWLAGEDFSGLRQELLSSLQASDPTGQVWKPAAASALTPATTPRDSTPLRANPRPPVVVQAHHKPITVTQPLPGTYVYDFGKNLSGWPQLELSAPRPGATISMIPSETLGAGGLVDQLSMGIPAGLGGVVGPSPGAPISGPIRYDYVTGNQSRQVWHPSFTYNGFRYLQVTGLETPDGQGVTALEIHADNPVASQFTSSNSLLNAIDVLEHNALRANMQSLMTDCPNREKGPYTGDVLQDIATETNAYDMRAYLRAHVRNFAQAQHPDGNVPATAPEINTDEDGANWGGAMIMVPWALYETYGDTDTLRTYYANMRAYLEFLNTKTIDGLLPDDFGLGDWVSSDPVVTPIGYVNSYGYYVQIKTMSRVAELLGKSADHRRYALLAKTVKMAFNTRYLDRQSHTYSVGTQAADGLALDAGLVPDDQRVPVLNHLVRTINAAQGLIKVGSVSLMPVLRALHDGRRDDVIYRWATSRAEPSYGYVLSQGNTTMTEHWDGATASLNHHFLGGVDSWFTTALAGIGQDAKSIGFALPVIRPSVVDGLSRAAGTYASPAGLIGSSWKHPTQDAFTLTATLPDSAPGEVYVPLLRVPRTITMDGTVIWKAGQPRAGVVARASGDYIVFSGVVGTHTFAWAEDRGRDANALVTNAEPRPEEQRLADTGMSRGFVCAGAVLLLCAVALRRRTLAHHG